MSPRRGAVELAGWGQVPKAVCAVAEPSNVADLFAFWERSQSIIARGNGRSYGDSSLNPAGVALMARMDLMLAFDEETGEMTCQAGVLLADVIETVLRRGWFPPVTPGTRFVTIGGMIAADVHGKNHHHAGCFADHVLWLDLALPSGDVLRCSKTLNQSLFLATCGGLGLTGVILRAAFRCIKVETAYICQTTVRASCLDEAFAGFEARADSDYSVAWIDGLATGPRLGRSILFFGEHASRSDLDRTHTDPLALTPSSSKSVPIFLPNFALSRLLVSLFNEAYYRLHTPGQSIVDIIKYFYPLDDLLHWNRIYGHRGFMQYQCVLPLAESAKGIRLLLEQIAAVGDASFLAVLKRMGRPSSGYLSFPIEGYTLAMDFPFSRRNVELLDRLDAITAAHGGRIYLAKDARTSADMVARGYDELGRFQTVRLEHGLLKRVSSLQARRLQL